MKLHYAPRREGTKDEGVKIKLQEGKASGSLRHPMDGKLDTPHSSCGDTSGALTVHFINASLNM